MSEESVATEGLHSHYCNICEGDWDHDGACQEGAVACCPWCFAMANAAPVPGGRRGPHFHFCPDCTQNWQHQAACSAPLRVVLPDCTGCRGQTGGRSIGRPSRPHGARLDFIRGARLVRKIAGPAAIAAGVIVAVPLLILASSLFWSRQPRSVARVPEPHVVVTPPAPQPQTPQPETPPPAAQAPAEPLPSAAQVRLHREGERREGRHAPSPGQLSARVAPPSESTVAAKSAAPANPPGPPGLEEPRGATPASPPALPTPPLAPAPPREAVAEIPRAPEAAPPPPSENWTAAPGPAVGAVPGALSQGGGAALDTLLPGPRRFANASQPRRDQLDWSSESPRWDRTAISALMRAVVEIRPAQRRELQSPASRGFVVDELGHVLTSDQRLGDATVLAVVLPDGRTLAASVILRDRLNHIAVLRLARRGAPAIPLGDSATLTVGERVLAISNGIGNDRAPAAATVLATGAGTGGNLAIDLTPMPDGIGGPLLNQSGAAIGILIDSAPSAGAPRKLTFAVPIDRVKALLRNARPRPLADLLGVPEGR